MSIKTWQETVTKGMETCDCVEEMQREIDELRAELIASKQNWGRFHHLMKKYGWHPGRTDDDLIKILEVELAAIRNQKPFGSISKNHIIEKQEPWCREVLLYSPNNKGDAPERRVSVYLAAGAIIPEGYQLVMCETIKGKI